MKRERRKTKQFNTTVKNMLMMICIFRDSDISSSVGGLKPRLRDYDTGMDSGDDLEEEDFSA